MLSNLVRAGDERQGGMERPSFAVWQALLITKSCEPTQLILEEATSHYKSETRGRDSHGKQALLGGKWARTGAGKREKTEKRDTFPYAGEKETPAFYS